MAVQIVSKKTLVAFWTRHPQSKAPLTAWYQVVDKVEWRTPADIKAQFGANVDFVSDNRAIFDIAGNKYRVIVHVSYTYKRVLIKFVGTHAEYDKVDAETV
jgi:mRNA interferase HigB